MSLKKMRNHFYGRMFTPWNTPAEGKYLDPENHSTLIWQGIVEDHVERNRPRVFALGLLSVAAAAATLYAEDYVTKAISAAVTLGLAIYTSSEVDRLFKEILPFTQSNGPRYWFN